MTKQSKYVTLDRARSRDYRMSEMFDREELPSKNNAQLILLVKTKHDNMLTFLLICVDIRASICTSLTFH